MNGYDDRDDALEQRQPPGIFGIGRSLRSTFDADNHDSLGSDLTALMLQLSRTPEPSPKREQPPAVRRGFFSRLKFNRG